MQRTINQQIGLSPISKNIAKCVEEMELEIANTRKRYGEYMRVIEQAYQLAADLDAVGVRPELYSWSEMRHLRIDLGTRPDRKRTPRRYRVWMEKLRNIRRILGAPLKVSSRSVSNSKRRLISNRLNCEAFPFLEVIYRNTLPKNAKCRIVRQRSSYSNLVCEV